MNKKAFTMFELLLVIVVCGMLALVLMPKYLNLSKHSELQSRDAVIGAVRAGIIYHHAKELVENDVKGKYPSELDKISGENISCSPENRCFEDVMINPVESQAWKKLSAYQYQFNSGSGIFIYVYDPQTGSFELAADANN
ncbi:MAG: hypothetical protein ABIE74_01535 [Pseudomonadota bacterium]